MSIENQKPIIGFTCGDINGIGIELIIKTLGDNRILEFFTPVIFASNKVINFYRKAVPNINFNFQAVKDFNRINAKMINVYNCWEDEVNIQPGQVTEVGGKYAALSLQSAALALKNKQIHGLVTAPIHKKNIHSENFPFTGHTPFFKHYFEAVDVLMLMCADNIRVALATEHLPVSEIASHLTRVGIYSKLSLLNSSLQKDFGIDKPKIAVLGLNPHSGDEGLIGSEEIDIIKPAIKDAKQKDMMVFGPFSADAFFARHQYENFDAVLAMYHDQGLIPFKSLAINEGVNYTAGLPVIRTSPDHGTAFDIAGKNKADESSFRQSVFTCLDILHHRFGFAEMHKNPLRKISAQVLASVEDERIEEN